MSDPRTTNRAMFWRILRRLLSANRARLCVMLLALAAGAAVTAALLNLQVDAKRRLTTEFRAFGANIIVAPRGTTEKGGNPAALLNESTLETIRRRVANDGVAVPFLFMVAHARKDGDFPIAGRQKQTEVVVAGTDLGNLKRVASGWKIPGPIFSEGLPMPACFLGEKTAGQLGAKNRDLVVLSYGNRLERLEVVGIISAGGAEDNQIFIPLPTAQHLAGLNGQLSLIQISYAGAPRQIESFQSVLASELPGAEVRPIRQFTEGEAKIYTRISGLLTATVGIVLLLTALCVMAAMTNVAMERKMDVGLMKAIGGATQRVLRLFLAEAALLGLAGGVLGAAAGIFLSIGLGKAVFGVAARPRLIVYPLTVALTVIVAILSAYPLRRLASIRPASVFRGEA